MIPRWSAAIPTLATALNPSACQKKKKDIDKKHSAQFSQ
jgi:hypothetical protein